ncbi:hypothetical protein HBB16_18320 [Pseudonocardia sp. MCCB 268]|nr:hypothetical protein [Pseudonocardia cytotoxica]
MWLRRPEATATKDGRAGESTTRGIVGKALRFLADQGFPGPGRRRDARTGLTRATRSRSGIMPSGRSTSRCR